MGNKKTAEAATGNEVAVIEEPKGGVPANLMADLMADAQEFKEAMSREDMAIPFLQILQQLSPQCVEGDPAYIEGAKAGMFYNTVTKEIIDGKNTGVRLVFIAYKASFIEWVPRNAGGGFVHEYNAAEGAAIRTARNDQGLDIIQSGSPVGTPGNQLNYTHTHFAYLVREDNTYEPVLISATSTQVKPSMALNTQINNTKLPGSVVTAPRFFGVWRAKTDLQKNDQGSWYIWSFAREATVLDLGEVGAQIYGSAKEFARSLAAGEKHADYSKTEAGAANGGGDNPDVGGEGSDEGVPF